MSAPRFCYVLLSHTDPAGLERSVRRIRELSPDAEVVVRHSVPDLLTPLLREDPHVHDLLSEIQVVWGDWSMTRAAIEALAYARRTVDADHLVLLSGQDHPIRDLATWEQQVRALGADALVDVFPEMSDDWRYRWWMLAVPQVGPTLVRRALKRGWRQVAGPLKPLVMFYRGRRDPRWTLGVRRPELTWSRPPVTVVKGSLWTTLTAPAVDSVVRQHHERSRVRRFFERVRIPDESYLQSLLHADPGLTVADCATTHARFLFDEWSPLEVDLAELAIAAQGPAAFVRKMPPDVDEAVLAELDRLCARPEDEVPPVQDTPPGETKLTGAERQPGVPPRAVGLPSADDQAPRLLR